MLQLFHSLTPASSNTLQIICLITAWMIIIFSVWSSWLAVKKGIDTVKRMHRISCADCQFFTGIYQLKCPVHPSLALTEEAINCSDYEPPPSKTIY